MTVLIENAQVVHTISTATIGRTAVPVSGLTIIRLDSLTVLVRRPNASHSPSASSIGRFAKPDEGIRVILVVLVTITDGH